MSSNLEYKKKFFGINTKYQVKMWCLSLNGEIDLPLKAEIDLTLKAEIDLTLDAKINLTQRAEIYLRVILGL